MATVQAPEDALPVVFISEHGAGDAARGAQKAIRWRIGSGAAVWEARHSRTATESFASRDMFAMVGGDSRDRLYDSEQ